MNKRTFLALAFLFATSQVRTLEQESSVANLAAATSEIAANIAETPHVDGTTVFGKIQELFSAAYKAPGVAFNDFANEPLMVGTRNACVYTKDAVVTAASTVGSVVARVPGNTASFIATNKYTLVVAALIAAAGYGLYRYTKADKTPKSK